MPVRRLESLGRKDSNFGWSSCDTNIVGTPWSPVQLWFDTASRHLIERVSFFSLSFSSSFLFTFSALKTGEGKMISVPCVKAARYPDHPKSFSNGEEKWIKKMKREEGEMNPKQGQSNGRGELGCRVDLLRSISSDHHRKRHCWGCSCVTTLLPFCWKRSVTLEKEKERKKERKNLWWSSCPRGELDIGRIERRESSGLLWRMFDQLSRFSSDERGLTKIEGSTPKAGSMRSQKERRPGFLSVWELWMIWRREGTFCDLPRSTLRSEKRK